MCNLAYLDIVQFDDDPKEVIKLYRMQILKRLCPNRWQLYTMY